MKTATVILVALTVFTLFLESATAPAEQNVISKAVNAITKIGATVKVTDEDKQAINERIESTETELPRAIKIVADAISKATGTEKLTLVEVSVVMRFIDVIARLIHKEIRAAIASGLVIAIKAVIVQIDAAVAAIKASLDGFNKKLSPGPVKDGVITGASTSMSNASFGSKTLKTYV